MNLVRDRRRLRLRVGGWVGGARVGVGVRLRVGGWD